MITLDTEQAKAVETSERRSLVLAGAGSGKTRVLIERIAWLIENGTSPYEIMGFTFTRKAAGEMRSRLEERLESRSFGVTMGTMHGLALRMLQKFGEIIGLKPHNLTIYGEWEAAYLLKEIALEMGIYNGKVWKVGKKKIDAAFLEYYSKGVEPSQEDPTYQIFKVFIARCKENNALTYGGLLIGLRLLIPTMAKYLHVKQILVDEVQDIDTLQWLIILEMERAFGADLYVVGDIDQSIYEWRGAAPEYLVRHQDEFAVFKIENNYRSGRIIVGAANNLISHNEDRITKTMISAREDTGTLTLLRDADSAFMVRWIKGGEVAPSAILARNHALLGKLSMLLTEEKIKHTYVGRKMKLTNSEHFRRFHAFMKLLVNPYDNFSFLLIRDLIGLSRETYAAIRKEATICEQSHYQAWLDACDYEDDQTFQWWFTKTAPNYGLGLLAEMIGAIGDISVWDEKNSIIEFIYEWADNVPLTEANPKDYLSWLATYDIQDEIEEADKDILTLMTIHAAKGLEWPVVVVAGVNEGLIPSKQSINSGDFEAERRLAYVAWTRAVDHLVLAVRPETSMNEAGHVFENPVSRFIEESTG